MEEINDIIASQIYDNEVLIAESNQDDQTADFESYLGIIDGVRDEKNFDWESDIRIPEFLSHWLTQSGIDVGQYFGTRDFVEVKLNDPAGKKAAEATKELLNRTLNKRTLNHYQKFVRGKGVCNLSGKVYIKCWWEHETEEQQTGTTLDIEQLDTDVNGKPLEYDWQEPATKETEVPVFEEVYTKDEFNYDIWDQRNVFVSEEFAYTLNQKAWVIFRSEITLPELQASKKINGYFNLDKIDSPPEVTDTKQESYLKQTTKDNQSKSAKQYDLYERYGKYWVIENNGNIEPGIDINGEVLEDATFEEVIITIVKGDTKTLIGFKKTHFIDSEGQPYKPCIRGLCYIHPTEDSGIGDGQNVRELQTAIDDTFNASQNRVLMATFPFFKGARQSIEDNSSIYIEPGHMMELNDVNDVQEFKIQDNITGALQQLQFLENKGRQVDSINETTTGGVPSIASTTATAVSAATQNTNTRVNYKSLTFEFTALTELYWMIQQMTHRFATEETALHLMGDKAYDFNPGLNYYYTPLSQSIETEQSKAEKRKEWMQLLQMILQIQHPDAARLTNFIFKEIVKLMGDEYETVLQIDESQPVQGGQVEDIKGVPTSNEYGLPQSAEELSARGV